MLCVLKPHPDIEMTSTFPGALRRFLLALILTFSEMAYSSEVVPLSLEETLNNRFYPVNVIVVGTVRHREVVANPGKCHSRPAEDLHYTIEISEALVGKPQMKSLIVEFFETCGSPMASVFTPESGIEKGLKVGKKYIFLLYLDAWQKRLYRAEEEERRDDVLKAWRDYSDFHH